MKNTLTEVEEQALTSLKSAVKKVYLDAKQNQKVLIIGDYYGNPKKVRISNAPMKKDSHTK